MKAAPLIICSILCLYSCKDNADNRKFNSLGIPADAFYVKGKSQGYWFHVNVHPHFNNAYIKIYDEITGKLIEDKKFFVICKIEGHPIYLDDAEKQIDFYDGKIIHLKRLPGQDSCWLQQ